jgi:hypothetical protein
MGVREGRDIARARFPFSVFCENCADFSGMPIPLASAPANTNIRALGFRVILILSIWLG